MCPETVDYRQFIIPYTVNINNQKMIKAEDVRKQLRDCERLCD